MTNIIDIVDLVHPSVSGIAVIVSDQIWVLFDRELDQSSIEENMFVAGPDQDTWSGPDLLLYKRTVTDSDDILQSPDFKGIVQGTFEFERVNLLDLDAYAGYDYGGDGTLWRTKAIFTPSRQLTPNTEYRVYITGDESSGDGFNTGIKTRTVFDTSKGSNVGTGEATFVGSYTGLAIADTLHVKITTAGAANTAKFIWYRGSAPLITYGPFTAFRGTVALADGVSIKFTTGDFSVNDSFSVIVKQATVFTGNLIWPFTTGTGSIQELPSTVSTGLTGAPSSSTSTTDFGVAETQPAHRATDLESPFEGDLDVIIDFTSLLDESTITADRILVEIDPVNGDESSLSNISASGIVTPEIDVNGSRITLTIASGIINENNIITVTLDGSIADEDGNLLTDDYCFYFTSRYTPMYSSWRKVLLDYGAYLSDFPRDTINFAIFEASLAVEHLTWVTSSTVYNSTGVSVEDYYAWVRREFTTCKAAETLLLNALGVDGGLRSKRLGDLEVTYDQARIQEGLDKALGCLGKWEATIHGRGISRRKPMAAVKGELDPSSSTVGRAWDIGSKPLATSKSLSGRRWNSGYYSPSNGRTGKK